MYKMITHTITEEHFDHPVTAEYGIGIHHGNTMPKLSNVHVPHGMPIHGNVHPRTYGVSTDSVLLPPGTKPSGNIKVKMSPWHVWGMYDAYGDLFLHGDMYAEGDIMTAGTINGTGSTANVTVLATDPTSNTWSGNVGELAQGPSYMYLCTSSDTWVRWKIDAKW